MKRVALLVSLFACLSSALPISAQKKPFAPASTLCTREIAIDTTKDQILNSRTFDNAVPRIAVLIRAAELLWPHDQEKALAALMEAFDLAVQDYKQVGDEMRRVSQSQFAARYSVPDQRFKVIRALAKRDPMRAQELSRQTLQNEAKQREETSNQSDQRTAEKLLEIATGLAETDPASAVAFARASTRYPAGLQLSMFLYKLAKTNQTAADEFYNEAIVIYRAAPMEQFLYFSSYPFGNTREAGEMPSYTNYQIPEGFRPNPALQKLFVGMLLTRYSKSISEAQLEPATAGRYSEHSQMWMALTRLEKQIQTNLPEFSEALVQVKERLYALMNPEAQKSVTQVIDRDRAPKKSFDEQVEAAEKLSDVARRDQGFSMAVLGAKDEPLEKVLNVIDKISDSDVRGPLTNWFYYSRAQSLIANKEIAEARKLAGKVEELDQRAYLFTRIAEESLKQAEDQTEARQMLNEIGAAIAKAPKTINSARALLALAFLYTKLDANRGVEELGNAVKTINALENPDFTLQFTMMKIEGKTFGFYASYSTPGFDPENTFREMGKVDFDGTLLQAAQFGDKSLRGLTTLSVIEPCFAVTKRRAAK